MITRKEKIFYAEKIFELGNTSMLLFDIDFLVKNLGVDNLKAHAIIESLFKMKLIVKSDNLDEFKDTYGISLNAKEVLRNIGFEAYGHNLACQCEEREHIVSLFKEELSYKTLKLYKITIPKSGDIIFELNEPFERVDVFLKNGSVLKLSIPNMGSLAYTLEDAQNYFDLMRGCAEINAVLAKLNKNK